MRPEYIKLARYWRRLLRHKGTPYGAVHSLAPGEPEFNPMAPSAAWLEWRHVTHFGISQPENRLRDLAWLAGLARWQDSHTPENHHDAWRH